MVIPRVGPRRKSACSSIASSRRASPWPDSALLWLLRASPRRRSRGPIPPVKAEIAYTTDQGEWTQREWKTLDATLYDGKASANLPEKKTLVFFLMVKDDRGAVVSSPHVELK